METIVRTLLEVLSAPPVLVNPDWDAVADNSRPFLLYCDASVDGFGVTLEQEQKDGSIRPIVFISLATLESERHWTPLVSRLAALSRASSASTDICGVRPSASSWTTRPSRASSRLLSPTPESKDGSNSSRSTAKGSANGNVDFLTRLPLPASEDDRSGHSRLTPSDEERIYRIRAGGLLHDGPLALSLGLGGLAPSIQSVGLGELPLSQSDFRDFREHGRRMRIDDLDAPYGDFVARAPTYVFSRGPSRTLTSSMLPATSPLPCSSCPLHLPWLLPVPIRKIFLPRPPSPLAPRLLPASVRKTLSPSPPSLRLPI